MFRGCEVRKEKRGRGSQRTGTEDSNQKRGEKSVQLKRIEIRGDRSSFEELPGEGYK